MYCQLTVKFFFFPVLESFLKAIIVLFIQQRKLNHSSQDLILTDQRNRLDRLLAFQNGYVLTTEMLIFFYCPLLSILAFSSSRAAVMITKGNYKDIHVATTQARFVIFLIYLI